MSEHQEKRLIKFLRNHKATLDEIAEEFKTDAVAMKKRIDALNDSGILVSQGTGIKRSDMLYHINMLPELGNVFHISDASRDAKTDVFGASSDWHIASKYHLPKSWHEAMKRAGGHGVKRVLVAGDLLDGVGIYKGHLENLLAVSVEDQTDMAAEAIAKHPKLEFWAIAGNHDYSYTQQNGAKPLAILEAKVDNFKNLGDFRADIIQNGIRTRLLHGGSGRTYARSYPSQVYLRDYFSGLEHEELANVPQIMVLGHFHTFYNGKDYGMHILQPGSFQDGDNEFCIRRGLTGPTGMFVIDMKHKNGEIRDFSATYLKPEIAVKEKGERHARNTRNYGR